MADMFIETQIDQLAKLVIQRKKIAVSEAAKVLKTTEAQIEEWVRILEENGFVELTYPALGEPIILLKKVEGDAAVKKQSELADRKEAVEEKTKDFQKKVENIEIKVETTNKNFSKLESELRPKIKELEKSLKVLDDLEDRKNEMVKKSDEVKAVADSVNSQVNNLKGDIGQMEASINEHIKDMEGHENSIKKLNEDKKSIEDEIAKLEKDMMLIKLFVKKPISMPMLSLKNVFARHAKKTEDVSKKRKSMHKRALKLKSVLRKKS